MADLPFVQEAARSPIGQRCTISDAGNVDKPVARTLPERIKVERAERVSSLEGLCFGDDGIGLDNQARTIRMRT